MNDLEKMAEEVRLLRGGAPLPPVDAEGYSAPSPIPKGDPDAPTVGKNQDVRTLPQGNIVVTNYAHKMPVAVVDLANRSLTGTIGTFPLDDDDVVAFTKLGQKVMMKAVEAICPDVPDTAKRKMELASTAPTKPEKGSSPAKVTRKLIRKVKKSVAGKVKRNTTKNTTNQS